MRLFLARICLWLSDRLDDAGCALMPMPPLADYDRIDTSDRPFGMPPDVAPPEDFYNDQPRRK